MLREAILILNIISVLLFIYGVYNTFIEIEPNVCKMTYMFETPQFKKLHVTNKKFFSNYGLYYYCEGNKDVKIENLNGAPILFVPGNGGSYRQVRSLASVALRMKEKYKNEVHLDYFTIDYGEELSALYGGYLEKQKYFLQLCMRTIINLYQKSLNETVKIAIVGHSMGGVIAKSILSEEKFGKHVNIMLFLSTPIDRPVVNFDSKIDRFYSNTNRMLQEKRYINQSTELIGQNEVDNIGSSNDVLLISIGGGVRDLQVPAWLTTSRHSKIHAMTSAIPNVWLSCDHLSIVWCLQLMKVINRFFFSIVERHSDNYVTFTKNFESNFQSGYKYFVGGRLPTNPNHHINVYGSNSLDVWISEKNRQIYKSFTRGLQQNYNQLLPLEASLNNEHMYIEIVSEDLHDWLYGCIVEEKPSEKLACKKIYSLAYHISWIPTAKSKKSYALLDIFAIKKNFTDWTHILIRLPVSRKALSFRVDIFNPTERYIHLNTASWFDINEKSIISKTPKGVAFMKLIMDNMTDTYISTALNLQKLDCTSDNPDITIKITAPWEKGFDVYHVFRPNEQKRRIVVTAPTERIPANNSTESFLNIVIFLDSTCRLSINQQFSFPDTMRRIIQRSFAYLPGYLTTILLLLLTNQYSSKTVNGGNLFKKISLEFVQTKSLFIAITCNVFLHFFSLERGDSQIVNHAYPFCITLMLQGTAIIISIVISFGILLLLLLFAGVFTFMTPKLSGIFKFFSFSNVTKILNSRLTLGVVIISTALVTCCGFGLVLTYLMYFFWISNTYQVELLGRHQIVNTTRKIMSSSESINQYKESKNFIFHYKLLQLLFILVVLNASEILAWAIKYPQLKRSVFTDFQSISTIFMLFAWAILWEMEDISFLFNNKIALLLFYGSAAACIFYAQDNVFRLNYIIDFVFISLVLMALFHKLRKLCKFS